MPDLFNIQIFADEVGTDAGSVGEITGSTESVNSISDGVATENMGEQIATAETESWDSLIKGRYKKEYGEAVENAIKKRFRNQKDLQGQIDAINPLVMTMAEKYGIKPDATGRIPIDALSDKILNDNSMYEQEAFDRGMNVEDLKQMKALERENALLKAQSQRSAEQAEWDNVLAQGNAVKEMYPDFDLDVEMQNPQFGRLLATMQKSGFPNALQQAYEVVHRDEIMGGAMRYAVQQTQQKISNSIQSGMSRPLESGVSQSAPAASAGIDPSKLTKTQIEEIKARAARGERITF